MRVPPGRDAIIPTCRQRLPAFVVALLAAVVAVAAPVPKGLKSSASLRIAGYDYRLPPWWDEVTVELPDDLTTGAAVDGYVAKKYGKDTGTEKNWKEALKVHALAAKRFDRFPVYLAHCCREGKEYASAAGIYSDLYKLADTQGENKDWYRCYLAHNAGRAYADLKETDKAKEWHAKAAEYVGSKDIAIAHYARESAAALKALK